MEALRRQIERTEEERDKYRAALGGSPQARRAEARNLWQAEQARASAGYGPGLHDSSEQRGGLRAKLHANSRRREPERRNHLGDVVTGGDECGAVARTVEACQAALGKKPDRILADSNFASGKESRGARKPGSGKLHARGHRPERKESRQPPRPQRGRGRGTLEKLAALRQATRCKRFSLRREKRPILLPDGARLLSYEKKGVYRHSATAYRAYACPGKEGCPLANQCGQKRAKRRTVSRDEYQDHPRRVAQRMDSDRGPRHLPQARPVD